LPLPVAFIATADTFFSHRDHWSSFSPGFVLRAINAVYFFPPDVYWTTSAERSLRFFFPFYASRVAAVSHTAATTTSTICQLCIIIVVRITVSEHSPFSDAY